MALIVEDGTGLTGSNSYADLAYADTYFLDRGVTEWGAATEANRTSALIRASEYVDIRFASNLRGYKQFPDNPQSMEFPRIASGVTTGVPVRLKRAVCEYALTSLTEPLTINPQYDATGRQAVSTVEKVGPITEEATYARSGSKSESVLFKPFAIPDAMMREFVFASRTVIR